MYAFFCLEKNLQDAIPICLCSGSRSYNGLLPSDLWNISGSCSSGCYESDWGSDCLYSYGCLKSCRRVSMFYNLPIASWYYCSGCQTSSSEPLDGYQHLSPVSFLQIAFVQHFKCFMVHFPRKHSALCWSCSFMQSRYTRPLLFDHFFIRQQQYYYYFISSWAFMLIPRLNFSFAPKENYLAIHFGTKFSLLCLKTLL